MDNSQIAVVEQGYVRTVISARTIDLGRGVAIEIFGRLPDNCWKEAVRFDCFEREPHWHRFPAAGGGIEEPLNGDGFAPALADALARMRADLASWLDELGYPEGHREVMRAAFRETLDRIAEHAHRLSPRDLGPDDG